MLSSLPADSYTAQRPGIDPRHPAGDMEATRPHILAATDGSLFADAALRMAAALADRDGGLVEVETVMETPPRTLGAREVGADIARAASERGCELITLGLSEHDAFDRALGRETALQVARYAHVPVLAVDAGATTLPKRVMVAAELGGASLHTARAALHLLGREGTIHLVHVEPRIPVPFAGSRVHDVPAPNEMHPPFDVLLRDLVAPRTVRIECTRLFGDPVSEMLRFAGEEGIELIAAGTRRRAPLLKTVLGGIATKLFRRARCSVLLVPST